MSFAPPSPQPSQTSPAPLPGQPTQYTAPGSSFPPAGGSRSTAIPGLDDTPPTSAQFLGSFTDSPTAPVQPYAPAPGQQYAPLPPAPKRRGGGFVVALFILVPVIGIGVTVWAFLTARERNDQAQEILTAAQETSDSLFAEAEEQLEDVLDAVPPVSIPDITVPEVTVPDLSVPDLSVPTVPAAPAVTLPVDTAAPAVPAPPAAPASLFDPAGAPTLISTYEAAIGASPAKLLQIVMYPDYAFASAQSPTNAAHVDEYPYRDGVVGASSPVQLMGDGDLEANLFATTDVDWTFINRAVTEAPSLMPAVEQGAVTHVIVDRSVFRPDFSVTVRVYVSGPRGSGYVEYTAAGELIQVVD
jgi:hypothetical protein